MSGPENTQDAAAKPNQQRVSELATLVDSPDVAPASRDPEVSVLQVLRSLAASCYLNVVLAQVIRSLVVAVLPLYAMDLGGGPSEVGAIVGAYGFGYFAANVPGGMLLAMAGVRVTLAVATGCFGLSSGLCLVAHSRWLLNLSSLLLGMGSSMSILAQQTLVSSRAPQSCRGRALSTMGGVSRLAWAVGPFLGALLPSPQYVFALQLALCLLLAVAVAAFVPRDSSESKATGGMCAALRSGWRTMALILVFISSLQTLRKARELFFALAGRDAGLSDYDVGIVAALSFLLDMAAFPLSGRIMDASGRRIAGALSAGFQTLGLLLLLGRSPLALGLSGCVTGLGNGLSAGLLMTLGSDLSPSGPGRGPFLAVYRTLANSMEFAVPLTLGVLTETTGLVLTECVVVVVGILGVIWVLQFVPETRPETGPQPVPSTEEGQNGVAAAKIGAS